ncbi:MAG: putative maltokinase [Planctomycetaceae bacterium]|nr:putative maltokinase [Planctomycetaceae bacterium]
MLCRVEFTAGLDEWYLLPISVTTGLDIERVQRDHPEFVIAASHDFVVYDATPAPDLWQTLLRTIGQHQRLVGERGEIAAQTTAAFHELGGLEGSCDLHRHTRQQSHSSAHYGRRLMLKLFRKLADGRNPELEIGEFLGTVTPRAPAPALAGWLEYRAGDQPAVTVALLQEFVPNENDAWTFTLGQLGRYCERVKSEAATELDDTLAAFMGDGLDTAALLGRRTGELHVALASNPSDPAFAPERFTAADQQALHHSMYATVVRTFDLLRQRMSALPSELRADAERVATLEPRLLKKLGQLLSRPLSSPRIRVHGDYHLGQVLWTGSDFVIIDFEGEPDRPIAERRVKQSPLKDVAGMLRSFHYASHAGLMGLIPGVEPSDHVALRPWLNRWYAHSAAAFLRGYRQAVSRTALLSNDPRELELLLELFVLEKLVYELAYELNSRPDWARIPLAGLLELDS